MKIMALSEERGIVVRSWQTLTPLPAKRSHWKTRTELSNVLEVASVNEET